MGDLSTKQMPTSNTNAIQKRKKGGTKYMRKSTGLNAECQDLLNTIQKR